MDLLKKYFKLEENNTNVRTELLAGTTTFMTMAYIIVLQPLILCGLLPGMQPTGMDFGSVATATCLAAAIATAIMALYARYPIAQAPGMGQNFLFAGAVIPAAANLAVVASGQTEAWQVAMGVILVSGILFLILSLAGIREALANAISPSMKSGIAVGIGLFIAFIGLKNAGVIEGNQGTLLKLNTNFGSPDVLVFFFGLILIAALHTRKVKGSVLIGILCATVLSIFLKYILPDTLVQSCNLKFMNPTWQLVSAPTISPTFFKFDIINALCKPMVPFIVIFLFMDVFDTLGTLIGVGEGAGLLKDGRLVRGKQAMLSDAVGTVAGACLGTSTVTSYIESATGVEAGGRTGLTGLTVAGWFLLAVFFTPAVAMVGSYPSITAPALVVVGAMMISSVTKIDWTDFSECLPAFLILLGIPLSFSIADGLAMGFIAYPIIKILSGKYKDVNSLMFALSAVLLIYFLLYR